MNAKKLSLLLVMGLLFVCNNEIPISKPQLSDNINAKIDQIDEKSAFVSEELAISVNYPGSAGTSGHSYHMNWRWGDNNGNGWFAYNDVKVNGYNFDHNRQNLFVSPK